MRNLDGRLAVLERGAQTAVRAYKLLRGETQEAARKRLNLAADAPALFLERVIIRPEGRR